MIYLSALPSSFLDILWLYEVSFFAPIKIIFFILVFYETSFTCKYKQSKKITPFTFLLSERGNNKTAMKFYYAYFAVWFLSIIKN